MTEEYCAGDRKQLLKTSAIPSVSCFYTWNAKWIFPKRHSVDIQTKQENILNLPFSTGNSWEGDILTLFLLVPLLWVFPSLPFKLNDMLRISSGRLLLAFCCGLTHPAELSYWRAQFPHTTVQLLGSVPLVSAHFYLLLAVHKGGAGHFLSMPGGLQPPLCFMLRMNDTKEAHPLSVHRMGEWKTNSSKVFNTNRTKDRWKEFQICWLSSFSLLSLYLLRLPAGIWLGLFSHLKAETNAPITNS